MRESAKEIMAVNLDVLKLVRIRNSALAIRPTRSLTEPYDRYEAYFRLALLEWSPRRQQIGAATTQELIHR